MLWLVVSRFLLLRIGRVVFYILAAFRLAILCVYSSFLVLVIVCLDCLSVYFLDFTHFTLHSQSLDYQTPATIHFKQPNTEVHM
jgi:hypothetical protein